MFSPARITSLANHTFSYNIYFVTPAKRQQTKTVLLEIEGEDKKFPNDQKIN